MKEKLKKDNKKGFKEKLTKKNILIVGAILVVVIALIVVLVVVINKNDKEADNTKQLEAYMKEMGKYFYEDFYYPSVSKSKTDELTKFLSEYSSLGIKANLGVLLRFDGDKYSSYEEQFVNAKTNDACDKTKTMVIFYPQEPYGATDYKMEIVLSCDAIEKKEYKTATSEEALELMKNNGDYQIIDVRDSADYEKMHVVNSLNIPTTSLKNFSVDRETVLFVYAGDTKESKSACETLLDLGYEVYDLGTFNNLSLDKEESK